MEDRFSLLLLEEDEYYFRDHSCYNIRGGVRCAPWDANWCSAWFTLSVDDLSLTCAVGVRIGSVPLSSHMRTAGCVALCRLAGHLKLCSASLYFVPRNVEEPILRIPFRATTSIVRCHTDTLCLKSSSPRGASVGGKRCFPTDCSKRLCLAPATGTWASKAAGQRRVEARFVGGWPGRRQAAASTRAWRKGLCSA